MKDKHLFTLFTMSAWVFTPNQDGSWVLSPDPNGFFAPASTAVYKSSRPGTPVQRLTDGTYEAVDPTNSIPDGWMLHTDYLTP